MPLKNIISSHLAKIISSAVVGVNLELWESDSRRPKNLSLEDMDIIELNEAFAAQALSVLQGIRN